MKTGLVFKQSFQHLFYFLLPAILLLNTGFLFHRNISLTQAIPINGFCKYKNFKTGGDYISIFSLNYNNDAYSDLLLYSPLNKKINLITGNENGEFLKQDSIKIPFQFSKVEAIFREGEKTGLYAFTSRRDRAAGIFKISGSGKFSLESSLEFKSYPENISLADVNNDGIQEILLSGSAYDGLSLLYRGSKKLVEKKIEERKVYTDAVFVDLNNDGIPDIAGFDLITNSINLFYNNSNGEFRKVRSIPIEGRINSLNTFDMNSDGYEDLVFVKGNSILIFYNDFRSSFENNAIINTEYIPDKIITGDFNKDGKIDAAYINFEEEILSIVYAKSDIVFYPEIFYLKKKGIKDIIPYYSKFINGLAGITNKGEFFTISRLSSFGENVQIALAAEPSALSFFDNDDNGINDICFIDNFTNSVVSIVRNNAGIPYFYYSFKLFQSHSSVTAFNISPGLKAFFCYSFNQKLIEALVVDFSKNEYERKSIYSHGDINDFKIFKNKDDTIRIYAAYKINNKAGIDIFKYSGHYYINENCEAEIKNLESTISLGPGKSIFFWQKKDDKLQFCSIDLSIAKNPIREKFSLSLKSKLTAGNIMLFTGDLFNKDESISISFLPLSDDTAAVVSYENSYSLIKKNDMTGSLNVQKREQLSFGEMRFNGLKKLFVYYPQKKRIDKIDFLKEGKDFISSKLTEASNLSSYFIKNMNFKNYHIISARKNSSLISIKKITQ